MKRLDVSNSDSHSPDSGGHCWGDLPTEATTVGHPGSAVARDQRIYAPPFARWLPI